MDLKASSAPISASEENKPLLIIARDPIEEASLRQFYNPCGDRAARFGFGLGRSKAHARVALTDPIPETLVRKMNEY